MSWSGKLPSAAHREAGVGDPLPSVACGGDHRRHEVELGLEPRRAGATDPCLGGTHVEVGAERLLKQANERGVARCAPVFADHGRVGRGDRDGVRRGLSRRRQSVEPLPEGGGDLHLGLAVGRG